MVGILGEAEARIDDDGAGSTPAAVAASDSLAQLAHDVERHVVVLREVVHAVAVTSPVHRDVGHAELRYGEYISGSARPPLTSLTTQAPAATAARAHSARIVSMLTGTPRRPARR